jgi:oligopeptide transport system substrate-binding protein
MKPLNMTRTLFFIAFVVIAFVSCSKTETNFDSGLKNQILHIANSDEPRELDPQLSTGSVEHNIHIALSEGLTRKHPKTLKIQPGLAESWRIEEDGKRYIFKLRRNARWSNGDPITAHDFRWSWQRSLMPNFASEWAYMKYFIVNAEAYNTGELNDFSEVGVRALSDYELQVDLVYPTDFFLQLLDHPSYFPVHQATILAHGDMDQAISQWTRPENWVGNGPFKLTKWQINQEIVVEKNPNYWDASNIKLNGIHFYPITDQQAEVRAFRAGQIHLTYSPQMAIEKVAYYQEHHPDLLRVTPTYASYHYEFNVTKPPFDNKLVRQAFALAVDRQTLVERVTKAGERPSYSLIPHDPEGYSPKTLFHYDPDKAKQLLADAGYPNGEGFPEVELLYNTQDNHRKIALALQQMLANNLGVKITLQNQEWKVYLNTKKNLEHQIARGGWIADYLDPSNFLDILGSESGNNDTGWKNAAYDKILRDIMQTRSTEERYALFEQANAMLAEEMPVLPVFLYSDLNLVAKEVKGWHDNVMHYHPYNNVYLEAQQSN